MFAVERRQTGTDLWMNICRYRNHRKATLVKEELENDFGNIQTVKDYEWRIRETNDLSAYVDSPPLTGRKREAGL